MHTIDYRFVCETILMATEANFIMHCTIVTRLHERIFFTNQKDQNSFCHQIIYKIKSHINLYTNFTYTHTFLLESFASLKTFL